MHFIANVNTSKLGFMSNGVEALMIDGNGYTVIPDRIVHAGDTNTYTQFHAADQWRVVTGGGERLEANNSEIRLANNLVVAGNQYFNGEFIEGDSKEMLRYSDAWLRINEDNDFSSGIYCGTGVLRTDGEFQVGSSGGKFKIQSNGTTTIDNTISHKGLVATSGTAIDQIKSITKSLTLTTSWLDTGINGTDLATGTYIIQVFVDNHGANGQQYDEMYSGTMSWYSSNTNSTDHDEIVLHAAGHARNNKSIFLRVQRTLTADTDDLKLQITSNRNATQTASNYIFKFRRMI